MDDPDEGVEPVFAPDDEPEEEEEPELEELEAELVAVDDDELDALCAVLLASVSRLSLAQPANMKAMRVISLNFIA